MKYINVGCGSNRPGGPWVNIDNLRAILKPGTPERTNLDAEVNYVDWDLNSLHHLPLADCFADGILLSHVIEHFDCQQAASILKDCRRVLKHRGLLLVSVPDAAYFLAVHEEDTVENAMRLFGEPIHDKWHESFFDYALFHREHRQILTAKSLRCLLLRAGFANNEIDRGENTIPPEPMLALLNRRKFSLEMTAVKRV